MEQKAATIDNVSVCRNTDEALNHAETVVVRALGYLRDDQKKDRVAQAECKRCFYIDQARIGGATMATQPCGICLVPQTYGSTATDKMCLTCATKDQLCKRCGADLHLRPRRRFRENQS